MSVQHSIDDINNLILTTWTGEPTDSEMVESYEKYYREIKSRFEYKAYHEIVDFTDARGTLITLKGIKRVMGIAVNYDLKDITTKLAFVSSSTLIYNLALVYVTLRGLIPNSNKELQVFKRLSDAYNWMEVPFPPSK